MKMGWGSWIGLAGLAAIVVAVALPMYGDYTHRAQSAEAMALLSEAKAPLRAYFAQHGKWPNKILSATESQHTERIAISRGAGGTGEIELTATMRVTADSRVAGRSIRLVSRDGGASWTCSAGTMEAKNLPADCRN